MKRYLHAGIVKTTLRVKFYLFFEVLIALERVLDYFHVIMGIL
ncbi:hypothetical protein [Pedobacter endophyticus]|nr:hypothetical protein [Pedobacter endophyticus]